MLINEMQNEEAGLAGFHLLNRSRFLIHVCSSKKCQNTIRQNRNHLSSPFLYTTAIASLVQAAAPCLDPVAVSDAFHFQFFIPCMIHSYMYERIVINLSVSLFCYRSPSSLLPSSSSHVFPLLVDSLHLLVALLSLLFW